MIIIEWEIMTDKDVWIAPSILSADLTNLGEAMKLLEEGGADLVHLDVMDGNFVPNITFGPAFAKQLKAMSSLPFDAHLMIAHPMQYAEKFSDAGCEWIMFHIESEDDADRTIAFLKDLGVKVGISINPCTPFSDIAPYVPELDMIVVMTVEPGFGGQKCMAENFSKITEARQYVEKEGLDIKIMVDGGITELNIKDAADAGANIFVAGSAVFKGARGPVEEIKALKRAAGIP
jgi:ribulose-phosphate 3-epimerase